MTTRGQNTPSVAALFRLISERLNVSAIGAFHLRAGNIRTWAETNNFGAFGASQLLAGGIGMKELPPSLRTGLERDLPVRIDPESLKINCSYVILCPIRKSGALLGFLLILDNRRRWLGPKAAEGLRDCADLLADLMTGHDYRTGEKSPPTSQDPVKLVQQNPIVSHPDALSLIDGVRNVEGAETASTLIVLDMDRFHAINHALGMEAGDSMLAITATRLQHTISTSDTLIRMGADRFVVLSPLDVASAMALSDRLLASVSEPVSVAGQTVVMQATIGLTGGADGKSSTATLMSQADTALRRGKSIGGNRVVVHEPGRDAGTYDESRLELDLANAVDTGQMRLAYQPYIDLETGEVCGFEALMRWHHPNRGELQPAAFIELAEQTGQILPLGKWALETAMRQASNWPEHILLSVNISALQFHQTDFVTHVDAALAATGFPADRLELEITETVLLQDNPETNGQIRTLIARGIRIALDDFGTGYSALAYLARLPHHRIKLDKNFVQDIPNPATVDLIRAIISSARSQGIATTAEGVETQAQLEQVINMGFTHAQGFATGVPTNDPNPLVGNPARNELV